MDNGFHEKGQQAYFKFRELAVEHGTFEEKKFLVDGQANKSDFANLKSI